MHSRLEAVARQFRSDEFGELPSNKDAELLTQLLLRLSPDDRDVLRRWLAADPGDREAIASEGLKRRTKGGGALAQYVAMLVTHPEEHPRFIRVLRDIKTDEDG